MESLKERLGIDSGDGSRKSSSYIQQYISLRLVAMGLPSLIEEDEDSSKREFLQITKGLIENYKEREVLFTSVLCPADNRIQNFLNNYFEDVDGVEDIKLPNRTFTLDNYGVARELSLPKNADEYKSEHLSSYRVKQGILNNPTKDRRTTEGVFHIAEGGLPIPADKKAVPKNAAKYILAKGFSETGEIMELPYMANSKEKARTYVSLLLRPTVCPEVANVTERKSMEIRFFAPGSLVSNLDFVESIFGNGGSPYHIDNDAALDINHWTGHTGCIVLAPQLTKLTKKEVGLPHISDATERNKRDGMCWENENELYNDGKAFKLTVRTDEGIIVTLIADNYYGYSKKEIKTMIGYSSNLFGNTEEEHAGGAYVFPAYNQGDFFIAKPRKMSSTIKEIVENYSDTMEYVEEHGYAIDKNYNNIYYIPENSEFNVINQSIKWCIDGVEHKIKLLPNKVYILPNGSKFRMDKYSGALNYRLVESYGDGVFCHKPCTVSGGGKSEISKSVQDAIIIGSFYIRDYESDFKEVERIINYDYTYRYKNRKDPSKDARSFLNSQRSMGSVIKLLTPSTNYTDEYNEWLSGLSQYIKGLSFIIKRFYREEWKNNWKQHFTVDIMNGTYGNELKYKDRRIFARYLRVGFQENGKWRTFKLRQDYVYADKLQMEDDITASTVVPTASLSKIGRAEIFPSVKITNNCEFRFFQRPDDAKIRGYDKKAESDLTQPNTFISNFEPLTKDMADEMLEDVVNFERFTAPMQNLVADMANNNDAKYFVSSAHPRIVDGKPTANVRYLQVCDELVNYEQKYVAEMGIRIARGLKPDEPLYLPVSAVLPGRRNNPAAPGIRPLAVYNPVHYQELPELFMDFICSLTGKSPSTTGSGSEGALTKGPFNALCAVTDLNNALLSFIITGYNGFTTPAGYIGKDYRVDHDISILVPEIWSRLSADEVNPNNMLANEELEKIEDFEYNGKQVLASRLGYRITNHFINNYFGRVFENPNKVFDDNMLRPELQSMEEFVDGINNIVENHAIVAQNYFNDGSVEAAIPPLKAILHIMVNGEYEGKTIESKEIRELFNRDVVMNSSWYLDRLKAKQAADIELWSSHDVYIRNFMDKATNLPEIKRQKLSVDLERISKRLEYYQSADYLESLKGTIGKDILYRY